MNDPQSSPDHDVVKAVLARRHSCRSFTGDEIPPTVIEQILSTAQLTPSWCNTQPWQVTIVSGPALKELSRRILDSASAGDPETYDLDTPTYEGESLARRRAAGWALYGAVGVVKGDRVGSRNQALENFRFFGAPHVAFITTERALGTYGVLDVGGFVSTFLTTATSLGVATIAQAAAVSRAPIVRDFLGVPDDRDLVCAISFGREDEAHPANGFRTERVDWRSATRFMTEVL